MPLVVGKSAIINHVSKLVCNHFGSYRIFPGALTLLWPTSPPNVAVASWDSTLAGFLFEFWCIFFFGGGWGGVVGAARLSEYTRFKEEVFSLSLSLQEQLSTAARHVLVRHDFFLRMLFSSYPNHKDHGILLHIFYWW